MYQHIASYVFNQHMPRFSYLRPTSPFFSSQTGDVSPEASRVKFQSAIDAQDAFSIRVFVQPAKPDSQQGQGQGQQRVGSSSDSGARRCLSLQFRCAHNSTMDSYMPLVRGRARGVGREGSGARSGGERGMGL